MNRDKIVTLATAAANWTAVAAVIAAVYLLGGPETTPGLVAWIAGIVIIFAVITLTARLDRKARNR